MSRKFLQIEFDFFFPSPSPSSINDGMKESEAFPSTSSQR